MDRKYEEDTNDTDDIADEEETINDTFEEGSKEDPLGWLVDAANNKYPVTLIAKGDYSRDGIECLHYYRKKGRKRYAYTYLGKEAQYYSIKNMLLIYLIIPIIFFCVFLFFVFDGCENYDKYVALKDHQFEVSLAIFTGLRNMSAPVSFILKWGSSLLIGVAYIYFILFRSRYLYTYTPNTKRQRNSSTPTNSSHKFVQKKK